MNVEMYSLDDLFVEEDDEELTESQVIGIIAWWEGLQQQAVQFVQLRSVRMSVRHLDADVSNKVLMSAQADWEMRLAATSQLTQALYSSFSMTGGSFTHLVGACLCHTAAIGKLGSSIQLSGGGHVHVDEFGKKIYHDDQHRELKTSHKVSQSKSREYTPSSRVNSVMTGFRLFPESTVGPEVLWRFSSTNTMSLTDALQWVS